MGRKYDIWVDLCMIKKTVPLRWLFIFRTEGAMSLRRFSFVKNLNFWLSWKGNKTFRKILDKFDIWVDLEIIKKKVPLKWRFIFRTDEAMTLWSFIFLSKTEIVVKLKKGIKIPENGKKMWYLSKFVCNKEKSSSLQTVYFQNWWSYEPLKFCYLSKHWIFSRVEEENKSSEKWEENVIFE